MTIPEIIEDCELEEIDSYWYLFLPEQQIPNYQEFKNAMEDILGKYKKYKKRSAFVFKDDPRDFLDVLKSGEMLDIRKSTQYFPTPEDLVDEMIDSIWGVKFGERILEPSAGDGAMIRGLFRFDEEAANSCKIEVCETFSVNKVKLSRLPVKLVCEDFMDLPTSEKYDLIIANPPFSKNQAFKHLEKMLKHLSSWGRIACVLPGGSSKNQKIIDLLNQHFEYYELEEIAQGRFKDSGTNTATCVLYATNTSNDGDEEKREWQYSEFMALLDNESYKDERGKTQYYANQLYDIFKNETSDKLSDSSLKKIKAILTIGLAHYNKQGNAKLLMKDFDSFINQYIKPMFEFERTILDSENKAKMIEETSEPTIQEPELPKIEESKPKESKKLPIKKLSTEEIEEGITMELIEQIVSNDLLNGEAMLPNDNQIYKILHSIKGVFLIDVNGHTVMNNGKPQLLKLNEALICKARYMVKYEILEV